MRKIAIFYHVGQIEGSQWELLYQEQIHSLVASGLYGHCDHFHVGINGGYDLPFTLPKMTTKFNIADHWDCEAETLKSMWKFANRETDWNILYVHTKGNTWQTYTNDNAKRINFNVTAWRYFMEYHVIHKWRICQHYLNFYDTVGCDLTQDGILYFGEDYRNTEPSPDSTYPYFRGNFWWAHSDYIKTLITDFLYDDTNDAKRYQSERWIGSGGADMFSLKNTGLTNLYLESFLPTDYMD